MLKRKLRSRQGMTLLLSLLLFLMCAVGGSVAITAGTASAGTVSERAKLDQRYFSVMSAAELLRENFHEKHVSVLEDGSVRTDATGSAAEFLKDQSLYLLRERGEYAMSEANLERAENAGKWLTKYEAKVSVSGGANANGLSATVEISRVTPGKLEFAVKSAIKRGAAAQEEQETFGVKIECVASLGPVENGVQVNWEIGAIRLAD